MNVVSNVPTCWLPVLTEKAKSDTSDPLCHMHDHHLILRVTAYVLPGKYGLPISATHSPIARTAAEGPGGFYESVIKLNLQ